MEKLLGDRVLEIWKIFLQSFFQPNRERNPSWRKCFVFGFLIFLWQSFIRQKKLQRDGSRSHIDCCYENKQSVSQTFPGTWLTRVKARFIADIKIVVYELSLKIIYIYIYSEYNEFLFCSSDFNEIHDPFHWTKLEEVCPTFLFFLKWEISIQGFHKWGTIKDTI